MIQKMIMVNKIMNLKVKYNNEVFMIMLYYSHNTRQAGDSHLGGT
jgi:hypothetical protein